MNEALIMKIGHRMAQLPENEDSLYWAERPFAETLPILNMVRGLQMKQDKLGVSNPRI